MTVHNEVWDATADASASGRNIIISSVSSPGALLHTATATADSFDEIWIWATGLDSASTLVTIGFGGFSAGDLIAATIPSQGSGPWCIVPGWRLSGGLPVYGWAARSAVATVKLQINRTLKVTS